MLLALEARSFYNRLTSAPPHIFSPGYGPVGYGRDWEPTYEDSKARALGEIVCLRGGRTPSHRRNGQSGGAELTPTQASAALTTSSKAGRGSVSSCRAIR